MELVSYSMKQEDKQKETDHYRDLARAINNFDINEIDRITDEGIQDD